MAPLDAEVLTPPGQVFLDHASRDLDRLVQTTPDGKAFSTAIDWQWDGYFEDMIKGIKQFVTDPQERKKAAARRAR